ncbi:GTP-binding protein [Patescibacteria group bacterium]|nr:GTP-binding protein [Patescibacteria group bacterium]
MDKKKKNLSTSALKPKEGPRLSSKRTQPSASVPPVVTVLGHVDHGKTTLLDAIRKTDIVSKEHGGITQKIGASKIEFISDGEKREITFIDTPGHEAFSQMRSRGTQAADIGLLVISSTEGIKPQTKESISILKQAKIPFIVVLTKSDLPEKNPEKIKQQLLKDDVKIEGYGGDIPVIEVSAKTNTNIKELLELILLVFEMKQEISQASESGDFKAVVVESKQDPKSGPLATVVIKNGTLRIRDEVVCEDTSGRVRTIIDDRGERLNSATVGDAVEVLGFEKAPSVGGTVVKKDMNSVSGKVIADKPLSLAMPVISATSFFQKEEPILSIVLCADTLGSLEAILNALPKEISVAKQKTGDVTPADVIFAKSIGAIALGFNIKIKPEVVKLARTEKVPIKNYTLIYELIDEVSDVLEGKQLATQEEILGRAKVAASFPFEKTKVLGIKVLEGRIAKGDRIRLVRGDDIIGETTIASLRQGKNSVSKTEQGSEAGVILSSSLDFTIGDMLISVA